MSNPTNEEIKQAAIALEKYFKDAKLAIPLGIYAHINILTSVEVAYMIKHKSDATDLLSGLKDITEKAIEYAKERYKAEIKKEEEAEIKKEEEAEVKTEEEKVADKKEETVENTLEEKSNSGES